MWAQVYEQVILGSTCWLFTTSVSTAGEAEAQRQRVLPKVTYVVKSRPEIQLCQLDCRYLAGGPGTGPLWVAFLQGWR